MAQQTAKQNSLPPIAKGEMRGPAAVAVLIVALTFLPYLFGWFITPLGYEYSGFISNPDDHNVYFSYMRQARDGQLVFVDQFTTEPQTPWFFHAFFLTLGTWSRLFGLSLMATYQIARVVCGLLLVLALYRFGAHFLAEVWWRRFYALFIATASGLGWLYLLIFRPSGNQPHPPDFGPGVVMPELITFLTLLLQPLFCFAIFLLVSVLSLLLLALQKRSVGLALLAGAAAMLLANIHTYDVIPLGLTILGFVVGRAIISRKFVPAEFGLAAIVGIMMLPPVLYQFYIYQSLPVFRLKAEVATLSPPPLQLLLGMGLPLLLAVPGAIVAGKRAPHNPDYLLPLVWFAAVFIAAYLPFPFQRKMTEGMQIPVCLLAVLYLSARSEAAAWPKKRSLRLAAAAALVMLCFVSNGFYLARVFGDLQTLGRGYLTHLTPPLYLRGEQVRALSRLDGRLPAGEAVLCNPMLGSYVPSRTGGRVYAAHWAETINYPHKLQLLMNFYAGTMADEEREKLLREEGIKYLLAGPEEHAIAGGQVRLEDLEILRKSETVGEIEIYEVK